MFRLPDFQTWIRIVSISVFVVMAGENSLGQQVPSLGSFPHILGTYPEEGGLISLTVTNDDALIAGIDFVSQNGDLVPIPDNLSASDDGFAFFLANYENQVTFGNLGATTRFTAGTTTQLSVGVAPNNDVGAGWGRGAYPVQIPLAPLNPGESALIGSFPLQGGPVSVTAIGQDFTISSGFFDFQSTSGALVPFDLVDATPFEFYVANTPNQIRLGSLEEMTFFENTTTTLPVGISAGASDVNAILEDSSTGIAESIQLVTSKYTIDDALAPIIERTDLLTTLPPTVDPPVVPPVVEPPVVGSNALVGSFPADGGPISIVANETVAVNGFDFQSQSGGLVPADDAAPFTFFLSNTPDQVTIGTLGDGIIFEEGTTVELPLEIVAGTEDVQAFWGDGATPVPFSVGPSLDNEDNLIGGGGGMTPVDPPEMPNGGGGMQNPAAVPEPSSLLVWVTLFVLCVFQRWRACFRNEYATI